MPAPSYEGYRNVVVFRADIYTWNLQLIHIPPHHTNTSVIW